jgi:hypothetical protein
MAHRMSIQEFQNLLSIHPIFDFTGRDEIHDTSGKAMAAEESAHFASALLI